MEKTRLILFRFKKVILIGVPLLTGLLLVFAGLNLLQLSDNLNLYLGFSLIGLALLGFILN